MFPSQPIQNDPSTITGRHAILSPPGPTQTESLIAISNLHVFPSLNLNRPRLSFQIQRHVVPDAPRWPPSPTHSFIQRLIFILLLNYHSTATSFLSIIPSFSLSLFLFMHSLHKLHLTNPTRNFLPLPNVRSYYHDSNQEYSPQTASQSS